MTKLPRGARPKLKDVQALVRQAAAERGVSASEVMGPGNNDGDLVQARWDVWMRLLEQGYSPYAVANAWGCDHTSIVYARRRREGCSRAEARAPEAMA